MIKFKCHILMSDNSLQHTKHMPSYQYESIETCTNLYNTDSFYTRLQNLKSLWYGDREEVLGELKLYLQAIKPIHLILMWKGLNFNWEKV